MDSPDAQPNEHSHRQQQHHTFFHRKTSFSVLGWSNDQKK